MIEQEDAFGHEVYDHFKGEAVGEIIERDDGYIDTSAGPVAYFAPYEEWPSVDQEAMKYAGGRILDIGCGAGRHSLYLQEGGFDVLGLDISPLAIEVCKLRGLKNAQVSSITQVNASMGVFDTILMLGNNFGLFANPRRARWLLSRFNKITSEQGRIIAGSNDIYQTTEPIHLAYQEWNRQRGRMPGQIRLRVRHKQYKGPWFDYLMVSKEEMMTLLEGTAWQVSQFIDSEGPMYIAIIDKIV